MYDFTALFVTFFAVAGVATAFAVAVLARVASEARAARAVRVVPLADRQISVRRAA